MKNRWCIRFIGSFSRSPNTTRVIGQKEVNIMQSLVLTGAGRPRRYRQGHEDTDKAMGAEDTDRVMVQSYKSLKVL